MEYAIEMRNIIRKFSSKEVLKGIDLKIHSGEIFGLLGPSGAGKTTLIKILTGQLLPSAGSVLILGRISGKQNTDYGKTGMMMDDLGLYERLSCYDNLKLFARIYKVPDKKVDEMLKKVDLHEDRKCSVLKLSKGMKGRLCLARALLKEPEILFLDEPTSGLDPAASTQIHELIQDERKRGATVFLTTHNMEEADKLCDHIALLNEGRIVEYGEPEEIRRKYNHQNKLQIRLQNGRYIELPEVTEAACFLLSWQL